MIGKVLGSRTNSLDLGLWVLIILISVGRKFMITVFIINLYKSTELEPAPEIVALHLTTLPGRGGGNTVATPQGESTKTWECCMSP